MQDKRFMLAGGIAGPFMAVGLAMMILEHPVKGGLHDVLLYGGGVLGAIIGMQIDDRLAAKPPKQ